MGKRIRVWFIRILALVIVVLMILSLGMNIFTGQKSSKEDQTEQTSQTKNPPVKVRYQLLIHIGIADAGIQIRRQLIVQRIAAGRQQGIHCGRHLGHQAVIHHTAAHGHPQLQHLRQLLTAGAHLRPEVDGATNARVPLSPCVSFYR